MVNRTWGILAVAILFAGCGQNDVGLSRGIRRSIAEIPTWISSDAMAIEKVGRLCNEIASLSDNARKDAIGAAEKAILAFRPTESNYVDRLASLKVYWNVATVLVDAFCETAVDKEQLWLFKLDALRAYGREIEMCRSMQILSGNAKRQGMGLTRQSYMENLDADLFFAVRNGFEHGNFVTYFHSLPSIDQQRWIARLKEAAGREVVVWNPRDSQVRTPSYQPNREHEQGKSGNSKPVREHVEQLEDGTTILMRKVPKQKNLQ